ncbi:hypothetical protein BC834DRAFT_829322, partial [Gloeopeniophorella convolvens]
ELSYEQWRGVLHLSTLWGFASARRLALNSLEPPTPFDQLLLGRAYSVDHYIVPALSSLCERPAPLTLDEIRQMSLEDVALVTTVREIIRTSTLEMASPDVFNIVKAAQAYLSHPRADSSALFELIRESALVKRGPGNISIRNVAPRKIVQGSDGPGAPSYPKGAGPATNMRSARSATPDHPVSLRPSSGASAHVVAQGVKFAAANFPPTEREAPAATAAIMLLLPRTKKHLLPHQRQSGRLASPCGCC